MLKMFQDARVDEWTHMHTDEQDKNSVPLATLRWAEAWKTLLYIWLTLVSKIQQVMADDRNVVHGHHVFVVA